MLMHRFHQDVRWPHLGILSQRPIGRIALSTPKAEQTFLLGAASGRTSLEADPTHRSDPAAGTRSGTESVTLHPPAKLPMAERRASLAAAAPA
jgi:hypothetical protein